MKYRFLGRTGLRVSALCLGCMTFGTKFFGIGQVDQAGADALIKASVDAGINFFDTADIYSNGESETLLGQALQNLKIPRAEVVLATKVRGPMSDLAAQGTGDVNNIGLSRKHIMESCEASLKRLQTDAIDLYQIHSWDDLTPIEETMRALDDLVRQGKVRYIGCSNLMAWQVAKSNGLAAVFQGSRFVSLQAYYSLVSRDLEAELLPMCRSEGLGLMVWSPLAGGFLSGKFRRDQTGPENSRRSGFDFPPIDKELGYDVVEALDTMAKTKGKTIAQLALGWLLAQDGVSTVILGAKKLEQLYDNLGAIDVSFTQDELASLNTLTRLSQRYPQWMLERQRRKV